MTSRLALLLAEHLAEPFPPSIVKGADYGSVEPLLIDADIYGWALTVERQGSLDPFISTRLRQARAELVQALAAFPEESVSYYERLIDLATAAIEANRSGEHR